MSTTTSTLAIFSYWGTVTHDTSLPDADVWTVTHASLEDPKPASQSFAEWRNVRDKTIVLTADRVAGREYSLAVLDDAGNGTTLQAKAGNEQVSYAMVSRLSARSKGRVRPMDLNGVRPEERYTVVVNVLQETGSYDSMVWGADD